MPPEASQTLSGPNPSVKWFMQAAAALAVLLFFVSPLQGGDDGPRVEALLKKMAQANRELSYQGIFTYEHAGVLKSARVERNVYGDIEHQRLRYLSGPPREVERVTRTGGCFGIGHRLPRGALPEGSDRTVIDRHYHFHWRGEDRIADRHVEVIHLDPRDGFRYGYVFAIDRETGLLLQSMLVGGASRRVLERFQFVDVAVVESGEMPADIAPGAGKAAGGCRQGGAVSAPVDWAAGWVPPGFTLVDYSTAEQGLESLLYTDGLTVFSIFLDRTGGNNIPEVQARRGATIVQLKKVDSGTGEYAVSVVGEIPAEAAERIATFVTFNDVTSGP